MPWLTILSWLISFLASYSKTKNAAKSALIATGVAAAAYYTVEPTNPTAVWGDASRELFGMTNVAGTVPVDPTTVATTGQRSTTVALPASTGTSFGSQLVGTTGDVLKSWGAVGTMGVVGATAAVASGNTNWLWLAGGAVVLLMLIK